MSAVASFNVLLNNHLACLAYLAYLACLACLVCLVCLAYLACRACLLYLDDLVCLVCLAFLVCLVYRACLAYLAHLAHLSPHLLSSEVVNPAMNVSSNAMMILRSLLLRLVSTKFNFLFSVV